MALVTKGDEGNRPMADELSKPVKGDEGPDEADRADSAPAAAAAVARPGGFFNLYKPGQGYWVRMGTAGAAVLLLILIGRFMYVSLHARTSWSSNGVLIDLSIVTGVILVASLFLWKIFNKPSTVEFLIATESEMRKVNWTSRKDLIGSTKVVILFMFLIAALLFVIDIVFGYFFWAINVLKQKPF